jgi:hypothetical protein
LPRTILHSPIDLPRSLPAVAEAGESASLAPLSRQTNQARLHALEHDWPATARALAAQPRGPSLPASLARTHAALESDAEVLLSLKAVRDAIAGPLPNDLAPLQTHLDRLSRALEDGLIEQLRHELFIRAHLEGQASAASRFLPTAKEKVTADTLLRDLKALGDRAGGSRPAAAKLSESRIDSVLGPLPVPESPTIGFRPGVKEAIGADMPAMERLAASEKQVRQAVLHNIEQAAHSRESRFCLNHYNLSLTLRSLSHLTRKDRREDEARLAGVQQQLGRALTPGERLMARHLLARKSVGQTVAILRRSAEKP